MGTPIDMFDYELPEQLIAKYPENKRDKCRLMVLSKSDGRIEHKIFSDIVELIDSSSFLVVNNTKVHNARMDAFKPTGGKSELFVTEVLDDKTFKALVKGKFKPYDSLLLKEGSAQLLEKDDDGVWLVKSDKNIEELMVLYGHTPLPPYIKRLAENDDKINYQTVYAKSTGSSAAPTAGLHFTEELLTQLRNIGVEVIEITLHVGLGTFRPVKTLTIEEHIMHWETYNISPTAATKINDLKCAGKKLIAVGSTVVRALESATDGSMVTEGTGKTKILITPPYKFKIVDSIITNFHLPKSTLIAMMAAFAGQPNIMNAYKQAAGDGYRFFSYGDAMFIIS